MKTGRSQWTPSSPIGHFQNHPLDSIQSSQNFSLFIVCMRDLSQFPKRPISFQTALPASRPSSAAWCLCQVSSTQPTSKFKSGWRSWPCTFFSHPPLLCKAVHGRPADNCSWKSTFHNLCPRSGETGPFVIHSVVMNSQKLMYGGWWQFWCVIIFKF